MNLEEDLKLTEVQWNLLGALQAMSCSHEVYEVLEEVPTQHLIDLRCMIHAILAQRVIDKSDIGEH